MSELAVGQIAPDFELQDERGTTVRLSSYRGKHNVLLIFYPGDDTPGCTIQLCAIRDDAAKFEHLNTKVFGVNHAAADSHQHFIEKHHLTTPLLIDPDRKVSRQYGAIKKFFGRDSIKRSVVLIDQQGVIRYLVRGLPDNQDILNAITSLSS